MKEATTRTPVPLSDNEIDAVKTLSEALRRSKAQVLRGLIRAGLKATQDDADALDAQIRQ